MKFEFIKGNKKLELLERLVYSLDDLYDDLSYHDNTEKEIECINNKIKIREFIIKNIDNLK